MNIYISYFYKIRFFNKNIIPISTAIWDPKWYHQFNSPDFIFKDKNQVYNGLRIDSLQPGESCKYLCHGRNGCKYTPDSCQFLINYQEQLNQLDFQDIMKEFNTLSKNVRVLEELDRDPDICLIVYEDPTNTCSERVKIIDWFRSNNYDLKEWDKIYLS